MLNYLKNGAIVGFVIVVLNAIVKKILGKSLI